MVEKYLKENKIIVKTLSGLEPALAEELNQLGAQEVEIANRAVLLKGDLSMVYKCNYLVRTALRVLIPIKKLKITNQEQLYKGIKEIEWDEFIQAEDTLAVDSVCLHSSFNNSMFVSMKTKDAIVDFFRDKYGVRPSVDLERPALRVNIHIHKEECSVSLDSSGGSLHKRGYRNAANKAPLNEVLASGLILLSGWNRKSTFLDPMCGSGTIAIEAALIAKNFPAGFHRSHFGFELWKSFDATLWNQIKEEALTRVVPVTARIIACDNADKSIRIARQNIAEVGLKEIIELRNQAFEEADAPDSEGTIIMNPPYGERMDKDDIELLYKNIGDTFKKKYQGWQAWIISSNREAINKVGLKTSRKIPVYNGPLECRFVKYEMYSGTKKFKAPVDTEV